MQIDPNDLMIYAAVVEAGSFTQAAKRLDLPKSSVSRRVAALEEVLGERLLTRTTRSLTITDFGQGLLTHARRVGEEIDAVPTLAEHRHAEPSGMLRVSMLADFSTLLLAPMLTRFTERYPRIELRLDLSPRRVDLVAENFDLAIRMGRLADDATLVARRVGDFASVLVATPDYLARHGTPQQPDDLLGHTGLRLLRGDEPASLELRCGNAHWQGLLPGRVSANSLGLLLRMAEHGAGIAVVSLAFVSEAIARGELVRLLPDWQAPSQTAWAVMPSRRQIPAKTRAFVELLIETLAGCESASATRPPETG